MILKMNAARGLALYQGSERIYRGDNKISKIEVVVDAPTIGEYAVQDCAFELRVVFTDDRHIAYKLTLDEKSTAGVDITTDLTAKEQDLRAFIRITHAGNVVGVTNTVTFKVYKTIGYGDIILPRDELDDKIAELEKEKVNLQSYIAEMSTRLAKILCEKGIEVSGDDLALLIEKCDELDKIYYSNDSRCYLKNVVIPYKTINIGDYAFYNCSNLTNVTIPDSVKGTGSYTFMNCNNLQNIILPNSVISIGNYTFQYCSSFTSVTIPNSVTSIGRAAFAGCENLTTVTIPNSVTNMSAIVFSSCEQLENVTIEAGFNCNGLDLSPSTLYTAETIVSWLEALADRTGLTPYTLTIGSPNLSKLTPEQIAIATDKNWNLA